jgi:aspartate/methionine/tyrosine aminotransferase
MFPARYMQWAKSRRPAASDLAGSNMLACTVDELHGAREALAFIAENEDGHPPLLAAIARRYGVGPERVATAPGAGGANFLAYLALLEPGAEVLVEQPTYDPLLAAAATLGARIARFERRFEEGYALDLDRIAGGMTAGTRLVVVTNPHNPSGVATPPGVMAELGRLASSRGALVLVDEVYLDAIPGRPFAAAATLGDSLITTSSLTKAYGLNALRCGWVLAAPEVAERVRRARDLVDGIGPAPTELLSLLAFAQLDRLAARARAIVEPNAALVRSFVESRSDLAWVPPAATIAFPRLVHADSADRFVDRLLAETDTAVVPGRFFDQPAHFRIAFAGRHDALERGLRAIERMLDAGGW